MTASYFKISYDNAKRFLQTLPEEELDDLYDNYNISEDLIVNGDVYDKVSQLTEMISDNELYSLGYKDPIAKENDKSEYSYGISDVVDFLQNLDEYTLDDLFNHYDTHDIEELAIVITDTELQNLGFNTSIKNKEDQTVTTKIKDYPIAQSKCNEDRFDFLTDIPCYFPCYIIDEDNGIFATDDDFWFNEIKLCLDPNLVSACDKLDDIVDDLVLFTVTPTSYPEQIQEDVVINSELNPQLFDNETQLLKEDVLTTLQEYVNNFIQRLQEKGIEADYSDIQLIGSNAGYLYTPESDIDIHILWSYPMDNDNFEQMRAEILDYVTENPLIFGENIVELNVEDGFNMESTAKRRYSIINNSWVDNSNTEEVYTTDDLNKVAGYEDIVKDYTDKINNFVDKDMYPEAAKLKQEIRNNRSEDLKDKGSLSMGNVVFKELRNSGAFGKLRDYINNKELSIIR